MPRTDRRGSRRYDVAVVGEINPDLILTGDVTPEFGQVEKNVESGGLRVGSSAVIFACGAARLGLKVVFLGQAGDDVFGRFMVESMRAAGIDTGGVMIDSDGQTGYSVILSRGDDRAVLTYLGLIPDLRFDDIDLDLIAQAAHLHLSSYFLLDALRPDVPRLFAQARRAGLTVSLDTNYDPREDWGTGLDAALAQIDLLLVNETECKAITRAADAATGRAALAERIPVVAIKRGGDGATAQRGDEVVSAPPLSVTVVDTVGAGDSFDAGFVYGTLAGWSLDCCLKLAVCCGSLSTRAHGGTDAQPTWDEAATLYDVLRDCG